jgi:hypothetical protein
MGESEAAVLASGKNANRRINWSVAGLIAWLPYEFRDHQANCSIETDNGRFTFTNHRVVRT